ncbi:hypothetical protein [Streptomyces sp. NPDC047525]|uniref:hypothetical protein n=1 Tax=Streptomyces sp. NPDC047525 TaxID=3155264 RepID=UPI0034059039
MITLHEVYEQGSDTVKAAVTAFGARHPLRRGDGPNPEPDWKWAEKHFTYLIESIMGPAAPPQFGDTDIVRRAENEAIGFLLAVNTQRNYRCPICRKQKRPPL